MSREVTWEIPLDEIEDLRREFRDLLLDDFFEKTGILLLQEHVHFGVDMEKGVALLTWDEEDGFYGDIEEDGTIVFDLGPQ